MRKKVIILVGLTALLLLGLLFSINSLPRIDYSRSSDCYDMNGVTYKAVTDASTIYRLENGFRVEIANKRSVARDGYKVKTFHFSLNKNILIIQNIFDTKYYMKSDFQLPELAVENIDYLIINPQEENKKLVKNDEIARFLKVNNASLYRDGEVFVKFKELENEENISFEEIRQRLSNDSYGR